MQMLPWTHQAVGVTPIGHLNLHTQWEQLALVHHLLYAPMVQGAIRGIPFNCLVGEKPL
jgi:hypothetical protein